MLLITNLTQGASNNYAFTSCCDSEFEVFLELAPGEADHEVSFIQIDTNGTAGNNIQILEIGGIPYSTPYAVSTYTALSPTFILTQGNRLSIKLKYCTTAAGSIFDFLQFTIDCVNHPSYSHYFYLRFYGLDPANYLSPGQIVQETTDVTFSDCLPNCNTSKDILHLHNPTSIPVWMTSTITGATGFDFFLDGNSIDIVGGFWMPPGDSIIQISNPNCTLPFGSNFSIEFSMCSQTLPPININHVQNYCSDCGLDCSSVLVNTTHPNPRVTICPYYNNDFVNPNWTGGSFSGSTAQFTPTVNYIQLDWVVGGYTNSFIANNPYYVYAPNFNLGDSITIYWELETGPLTNSSLDVYFEDYMLGGSNPSIITSGNLQPNTVYSGSYNLASFIDPGLSIFNGGYFKIAGTVLGGDYIVIKNARIRFQKNQVVSLIPQSSLSCSNLDEYNTTAIGDYKEVVFDLYYQNGFQDNTEVWFNPFVFGQSADFGTKYPSGTIDAHPPTGYYIRVMNSMVASGSEIPMTLISDITQTNMSCSIEIIDNYNFKIHFSFFLTEDMLDWITANATDNERRLIYGSVADSNPYYPMRRSVFTEKRLFGALIYVRDKNWPLTFDTTVSPPKPLTWYECFLDKKVYFEVRWWNSGLSLGASEMSNPQFKLMRGTNIVNNLSSISKTELTFEINSATSVDYCVIWLFDTANTTGNTNFKDDYDSSRALIGTISTIGQLDNHLYSPSQAPTNIGGTTYQVKVTIGNNLNPNGNYHIGAICYNGTTGLVNSFLRTGIPVTTNIDLTDICCPMDIDVHWYDYTQDVNDACFTPTVKERIANGMTVNGGSFVTCLENLGMPTGASWLDYLTNVGLFIYIKKDNYPTAGKNTYFYYDVFTSDRNTAVAGNWVNNNSKLTVSDNGTTLFTMWEDRVKWEDTPFDGNNVLTGPSNQYFNRLGTGVVNGNLYVNNFGITNSWGGQEVYFEYNFRFDISSFQPSVTPFVLTQINKIKPFDFEPVQAPDTNILLPLTVEGYNGTNWVTIDSSTFCIDNYQSMRLISPTVNSSYDTGVPLFIFSYYPYTTNNQLEYEQTTGITPIIQLLEGNLVQNMSGAYNGSVANITLNPANLQEGTYQFCVVYQKPI